MPSLIGNKPNQVPSNGDLGTMAFQDANAVNITGGSISGNLNSSGINIDSNTFVIDATNNRVGVGIASPTVPLDVNGIIKMPNNTAFQFNDSTGTARNTLFLNGTNNLQIQNNVNNGSIDQLVFGTGAYTWTAGGSERMRITSTGNVGIGTTSSDLFARGYGRILNINSASSSAIEINAATGSSSVIDMGVNGTRSLAIITDGSVPKIASVGALPLAFETNSAERMRLDSSGNLGLGVTPSAWGASRYAIDMGSNAYVGGTALSHLTNNVYFNGTNFIYKTTATSGMYQIAGNAHQWYSAASGTAGNAITFTQAMTLDASGNLLVGTTTSGASKLVVNSDSIQVNTAKTPASASATGTTGQIAWDSNYVYVCVATNTWKRTALSTW